MSNKIPFQELEQKVCSSPDNGTTVLRTEFDKGQHWLEQGEYKGCTILLSTNYRCLDTYSDTQRVVHEGIHGTIWRTHQQVEHFVLTNQDNLAEVLERAYVKAGEQCDHDYGREVGAKECREKGHQHFGNCWHVYECSKCKQFHAVDSSG